MVGSRLAGQVQVQVQVQVVVRSSSTETRLEVSPLVQVRFSKYPVRNAGARGVGSNEVLVTLIAVE